MANTDASDLLGQHWIVMYKENSETDIEYFDPLGSMPSGKLANYLLNENYLYNNKRVQGEFSISCGEFCIFYLANRCTGHSMLKILDCLLTNDLSINEFIVKNYTRRMLMHVA